MSYLADLHLHSRFSRACAKDITIPNLAKWAKIKGIDLLGSGDFFHPEWSKEIRTQLKDRGDGIFIHDEVKFVLSCEVSCIYSHNGKVRRVHLIILLPSLQTLEKLTQELIKRGVNIHSDGRPIMGLSSTQLCEVVFNTDKRAVIIPAHAWTPWFALFGSNSGYDFLEECFGEYADQIFAIETGMSSDPKMNWRVAQLDNKAIVSFSDAHSLPNLGREATVFKGGLSYDELRQDLQQQNILETIEFFPEEGKYHYSGHRGCEVVRSPEDISKEGGVCPVCGKGLTIGVMQRVEELATRQDADLKIFQEAGLTRSAAFPKRPPYRMLIQLEQIIGESLGVGRKSKRVQNEFDKLIQRIGNEMYILTTAPLEKIKAESGSRVAEGVQRVREGQVNINPGYDGVYGEVNLFANQEEVEQVRLL